jgi:hypothetical protein
MPNDGGNLLLDDQERTDLVNSEPQASRWIRPFLGSQEFINGEMRWCLWLDEVEPQELRGMPEVLKRVEAVRKVRSESVRETTRKLAAAPTRFGENRQPQSDYLLVPGVSSERRSFIPIGYLTSNVIASNLVNVIPDATLYHFGILTSTMHMAWMRQVCGRLKSDYRYSAGLVYNNFPWPESPTAKQNAAVEAKAQAVLDARTKYSLSTLADLYDPLTMPADLVKAHADLDRAVDQCYRKQPFTSDRQRVEFLFALYERFTAPLLPVEKKRKQR